MARPRVNIRFNVANPRANDMIENYAGTKITRITKDMEDAARLAILEGYKQGLHPNAIALDLAGRINKATGRREGGIIGLSSIQAQWALNYRERLASGDPAQLREALGMTLRDKRFDSMVERAIKDEKRLSVDDVARMYNRYVDNAVQLRGETIARTETGAAVHKAAHEAFKQTLDQTNYTADDVSRTWRSAADNKVRHTHEELNGQTVIGLDNPFVSPSGAKLMHPLDDSLGAPADEIINCRCDEEINIDFAAGLKPDRELPTPPPTPPPPTPPIPPIPVPRPARPAFKPPDQWVNQQDVATAFKVKHGLRVYPRSPPQNPMEFQLYRNRAREADRVLTEMTEQYPGFKPNLKLTDLALEWEDKWLVFPQPGGKVVRASGVYYTNAERIEMAGSLDPTIDGIYWDKFSTSMSRSFAAVFRHEIGHALTERMLQRAVFEGVLPDKYLGASSPSRRWIEDVFLDAVHVSVYSATNWMEMLAEAFAVWADPSYLQGARRIDQRLEKLFDLLKRKP
jgi:F like protein